MIILEGPDGCGKSVLARKLSERYDLPVYAAGPPPASVNELRDWIRRCLKHVQEPVIQDRVTPVSEYVYSQIFPRKHNFPIHELRTAIRFLIDFEATFIYCRTREPEPTVSSDFDDPQYMRHLKLSQQTLLEKYDKLFWGESFKNKIFTYDYKNTSEESVYEYVSKNLPRSIRVREESEAERRRDNGAGELSSDFPTEGTV